MMAGLNDAPFFQNLAVPAVTLLIVFLAYSSQYLFRTAENLDPGDLTFRESAFFNILLCCLWFTYYKSCTVDPGRYQHHDVRPPRHAASSGNGRGRDEDDSECKACERVTDSEDEGYSLHEGETDGNKAKHPPGTRWCKKCSAPKPPRAHHCRVCATCVPRMDHHCPWTANCVSLTTFPHFLRFLAYTNVSLWTLSYFLYHRFAHLWASRSLPAYLGPSLPALIHLTLLTLLTFLTSLALGILLISTLKGWLFNMTTIEGWELEKHDAQFDAGKDWFVDDDGTRIQLERVEFPYDVGIFRNMAQAMGTSNVLLWLFPFAPTPKVATDGSITGNGTGWRYEENGFNRQPGMWPPPDPEKLRRTARNWPGARVDEGALARYANVEEEKAAFRRRQELDIRRWRGQRERIIAELEEVEDYDLIDHHEYSPSPMAGRGGKPGWANADGERLKDYGVDEEAEEDIPLVPGQDDDDIPLGEIIRRRKAVTREDE